MHSRVLYILLSVNACLSAVALANDFNGKLKNPLSNSKFYISPHSQVKNYDRSHPEACALYYPGQPHLLQDITEQSQGIWFGAWTADVRAEVAKVVAEAKISKSVPVLVAYNIPNRDCGGYSKGGVASSAYSQWIQNFALGVGSAKTVIILEPDALMQLKNCLDETGQAERTRLIASAVQMFKHFAPNALVYIDAGHGGIGQDESEMAKRLASAGILEAAGFSLNVSNYQPTPENVTYGNKISEFVGGKHFVIDTGRNGNAVSPSNEWCNPPAQSLGVAPKAFATGLVDAYLWIKDPAESDGECNGGPQAGSFWLKKSCELAHFSEGK